MNLTERLKVFLMVMGSVVMLSVGVVMLEGGITVPSETLQAHIEADNFFHGEVILPLISDMVSKTDEQTEIFKFILRGECIRNMDFVTDTLFLNKCIELGIENSGKEQRTIN